MNILLLTPSLPYPLNNGGLIRVYHLLINIASRHNVTLLCFEPGNPLQASGLKVIREHGIKVETIPLATRQKKSYKRFFQLMSLFSSKPYQHFQYFSKSMQKAIDTHLGSNRFDMLLVEFSQMGYYNFASDIPKYLDQHNVEYEIMQRTYETERNPLRKWLAKTEWQKYRIQEIENCEKFTACLTTSVRDADILKQDSSALSCHVIPNGVDSDFFSLRTMTSKNNRILFTGTISYYPNTEGVLWFHKHIWPLIQKLNPDAEFCIAGKGPPPEVLKLANQDKNIIVTGIVDDMRDYYESSAVVVVPLRVGGGTRLKILEAMSMKKAIVSTSVGAEGINHNDGEDILLKDTPDDFAQAVVSVMNNDNLRKKLEDNGRKLVESQYDWKAVSAKFCDTFESSAGC